MTTLFLSHVSLYNLWRFPIRLVSTSVLGACLLCNDINKSQGKTVEWAGICLAQDVFAHGQLYVAVSRVSHPYHIQLAL